MKRSDEILNELEDLKEQLTSVEDTLRQSLNNTRNNLMKLNIRISMLALGFSCSSVGFSAFGMNLINGLEQSSHAFVSVTLIVFSMSGNSTTISLVFIEGFLVLAAIYGVASTFLENSYSRFQRVKKDHSFSFFETLNSPNYAHMLFHGDDLAKEDIKNLISACLGRSISEEELDNVRQIADKNLDKMINIGEIIEHISIMEEAEKKSFRPNTPERNDTMD